ncbi:hypothetical protein Golob_026099 [Gossypium lobatum]|uniref:RNase H type-1 domain-containing protein n=1 Tax=Gossypium lobatum TaxID=34289 RepID=A0A7J8LU32_9ROSI|nr:hypothetical protein [Gossypium lobatum]
MVKRGLAVDLSCSICGFHSEDILYILKDCNAAKDVWSRVITEGGTSWACLFGILIWRLWKNRLKLVQRSGHDSVIILSNSLDVVRAIQGSTSATSNSALIRRIQSILSQEKLWVLCYIPREQNEVVDCMAKEALSSRVDLQFFEFPPIVVRNFLDLG